MTTSRLRAAVALAATLTVMIPLAITAPAQGAMTARAARSGAGQHLPGPPAHGRAGATRLDYRSACPAPSPGHAACLALTRTDVRPRLQPAAHPDGIPAGYGYGPSDLQSAYNLTSASASGGSGETVAIVDAYNDPDITSDLATYRTAAGLPACGTGCFSVVNQNGKPSPLPVDAGTNGWDVEESLDVDMVSATCPNCDILLVEANSSGSSDLYTAEDTAVNLGAKFVSDSWASCEYSTETSSDSYFNHPGVAITAASGDYAYDNKLEGCSTPSYPAASQYVTAVGGTTLTQDSAVPRGWTESVWAPDPNATGSGCSLYEPKPSWQSDTDCENRTDNDVAAVADPDTGVAIYDSYSQGGWNDEGGTSAASPIIASVYALAGNPDPGTYPASYPYGFGGNLYDITSGANGTCTPSYLCTGQLGYDGPSGNGTPDGVSAFQHHFLPLPITWAGALETTWWLDHWWGCPQCEHPDDYFIDNWDPINPISGDIGDNIVTKPGCEPIQRPDGSNAGIAALEENATDPSGSYCVDVARSTRGRQPNDPPCAPGGICFVSLAGDAVTWASRSRAAGGSDAPANLTATQLAGIYECTITNWDQVGGKDAPIKAFLPQTSSGDRSFFLTALGGGTTPITPGSCVSDGATTGEPGGTLQEDEGANPLFDSPEAIYIYSVAAYLSQAYDSASCTGSCSTATPQCAPQGTQNAFGCNVTGFLQINELNYTNPATPWPLPAPSHQLPAINTGFAPAFQRTLYDVVRYDPSTPDHIPAYLEPFLSSSGWFCSSTQAQTSLKGYGFLPQSTCGAVN